MAESLCIRLHHRGEFLNTKYTGGSHVTYNNVDRDLFSYAVLMEWVKENGYKEIGGIYVSKGRMGGWINLSNDNDLTKYIQRVNKTDLDFYMDCHVDKRIQPGKQTQPHVIVRTKGSPYKGNNVTKRKYVTIQNIQQQQQQILNTRRKLSSLSGVVSKRQQTTLGDDNIQNDLEAEDMQDDLEVENMQDDLEVEDMQDDLEVEDMQDEEINIKGYDGAIRNNTLKKHGLTDYEQLRENNLKENAERLAALNLNILSAGMRKNIKGKKITIDDGRKNYCSNLNDDVEEDVEEENVKSKQRKKVKTAGHVETGPTTRSRATKTTVQSEKQVSDSITIEANDVLAVASTGSAFGKQLKREKNKSTGSMAEYLDLRKKQKERMQTEKEFPHSQEYNQNITDELSEAKQKKVRGKTKMIHVHNRKVDERKTIKLNAKSQPIADNEEEDEVLSEFGSFLGTIARQYVPLDCVSWHKVPDKDDIWEFVTQKYIISENAKPWVLGSIRESWRGYKCRIKKNHYYPFSNDDERIKNKPSDIPLDEFKVLLHYWGDEKIQAAAERNALNRKLASDPHTAGTKSFARIRNKMKLGKADKASPTKAEIFVETRKRTIGRIYKSADDELKEKISQVQKMWTSGESSEKVDQFIHGSSSHSSSWLVGRHIKKRQVTSDNSIVSDTYLAELTAKIRDELADDMDEKVNQKVRENMTWMINKLAEKNPDLKIEFDDINTEPSGNILDDDDSAAT